MGGDSLDSSQNGAMRTAANLPEGGRRQALSRLLTTRCRVRVPGRSPRFLPNAVNERYMARADGRPWQTSKEVAS